MLRRAFSGGGRLRRRRRSGGAPVYLNVYDLTPINGYAYWLGLGVYHSGVEVHGVEYAYGAHEQAATGIFEAEPRKCPGFAFRKAVPMGWTSLGPGAVRAVMEELAVDFTGNTYNLIRKNCNHFCDAACLRLTGKPIPKWVNRLAKIGFLCNCVLPAQVAAVRRRGDDDDGVNVEKTRLRSKSMRCASPAPAPADLFSRSLSIGTRNTVGKNSRASTSFAGAGAQHGRH